MRKPIHSRGGALLALTAALAASACTGSDDARPDGNADSTGAPVEAAASAAAARAPAQLARVEFHVDGMTCGGCVIGTRAALRKLEGVAHADASYDDTTGKGSAWAHYDPARVTPERMMAAIRELGYTPVPVATTQS